MAQKGTPPLLKLGIVGTLLTCVTCFTPAAVMLLGFFGLARWAGYLDSILFPLLGLFLVLLGYGYWQRWHGGRAGAPGREDSGTSTRP
jgi:mercuric ion transport protein